MSYNLCQKFNKHHDKKVSFLSILLPLEHSCPHEQKLTSNSSQIFIFQHLMLFIYRTVLSLLLLQRQPWLPPCSSPSASIGSDWSLPGPHLKEDGGIPVPTRCPGALSAQLLAHDPASLCNSSTPKFFLKHADSSDGALLLLLWAEGLVALQSSTVPCFPSVNTN